MAWGKPKRNGRKACCSQRGQCSCQRRVNAEVRRNPAAAPHTCPKCKKGIVRGGVCPTPGC
jgi:hypothetical protein